MILKSMHVMCMYWGSGKDTSELENLNLLLLFTHVLKGYQCNYKMHAAIYDRHTACSVFYLEWREQTTSTSTYIQYKIYSCICKVLWTVAETTVTNTIGWSSCCVLTEYIILQCAGSWLVVHGTDITLASLNAIIKLDLYNYDPQLSFLLPSISVPASILCLQHTMHQNGQSC